MLRGGVEGDMSRGGSERVSTGVVERAGVERVLTGGLDGVQEGLCLLD